MFRRSTVLSLAAALAAALVLVPLTTASAANKGTPGSFTGYAFDACLAPSQSAMDAWLERSPYWGVGVYVAGANRFCADQPHLTADWVRKQTKKGWRILPLTVGRQASCFVSSRPGLTRIDPDPADSYAKAERQGRKEARKTLAASARLGFAKGSTHWLDIEAFDITDTHCRRSMLAFTSGWTKRLHSKGYTSGYYSSAASGITALEGARTQSPGSYRLPDQVWIAHWNGKPTAATSYLPASAWRDQRVRQYLGDHDETHGGVRINIDSNWMQVGGGTKPPKPARTCGVRVDFPTYRTVRPGARGDRVKALQCLLKQQRLYRGTVDGRYAKSTKKAVTRLQKRHITLVAGGVATRSTWQVLHTLGGKPLLKVGASGNGVRRLQRALNTAGSARLAVTGVYDKRTEKAVRKYQKAVGIPRTGVTTDQVWAVLRSTQR